MDSLSPQDSSFLFIENEMNHMHIATVAIFEGPAPAANEFEELVASHLELVPRYRQKVRFVPFDLGQPVWIDDEDFDLNYHVRHTALPAPGNEDQLFTLFGRLMSSQLDRSRPLWEMWVVEGVSEKRWALVSKTHHCLVDGVSGSSLMTVMLDASPDAEHSRPAAWEPHEKPDGLSLVAHSLSRALRLPGDGLRAARRVASRPGMLLRALSEFGDGLATFRQFANAPLEGALNGPIGAHRRWCSTATTLADIKQIRKAFGGTVNDVVLTAIALGFRRLLLARGEPVDGMRVRSMVPVSVRRDEEQGTLNNRVAAVFVDLPVDLPDPIFCLAAIRVEMDRVKEHHQATATETLSELSGYSPPALLAIGARLFADFEQHAVQTVTTNVPGPRQPLFAAGRKMLTAFPYVPIFGSVQIAVAIFSYAGQLTFGVTGDYDGAPDIQEITDGIDAALAQLLAESE